MESEVLHSYSFPLSVKEDSQLSQLYIRPVLCICPQLKPIYENL